MKFLSIFAPALGEMAEWSNAAVLKTVEGHTSGGSNPSFSAKKPATFVAGFVFYEASKACFCVIILLYKIFTTLFYHLLKNSKFSKNCTSNYFITKALC